MIDDEALKSIEKLHEMKASGIISEEEFVAAKQRLLTQRKPAMKPAVRVSRIAAGEKPAEQDYWGWMTFALHSYAKFEGRSSRKEFWMFQLLFVAVFAVGVVLTILMGAEAATVIVILAFLGLLVPLLAVEARRFHDQGRTGWLVLLNLIPYIGWVVVWGMMLLPGTEGDNEYGADPLV